MSSVSNKAFSSRVYDTDNVEDSSSAATNTAAAIHLWDWPMTADDITGNNDNHTESSYTADLLNEEGNSDEYYHGPPTQPQPPSQPASFAARYWQRRNAIYSLYDDDEDDDDEEYETDDEDDHRLTDMLRTPPMIINILGNERADAVDQSTTARTRIVIVDHDSGERGPGLPNRNLFFDFFGGGDSSEEILDYYRGRLLNAINAANSQTVFRRRLEYDVRND